MTFGSRSNSDTNAANNSITLTADTLLQCANEMGEYSNSINKLGENLVNLAKANANAFKKIDPKKLTNDGKTANTIGSAIKVLSKGFNSILESVGSISKSLKDSSIDTSELISVLIGDGNEGQNLTNEVKQLDKDGNVVSISIVNVPKNPGLLTAVSKLFELSGNMSMLHAPNMVKFKIEFLKIFNLFKWELGKLNELNDELDNEKLKGFSYSTKTLSVIMTTLPETMSQVSKMFKAYGKRSRLVKRGGERLKGSVEVLSSLYPVLITGHFDKDTEWSSISKSLKTASRSIQSILILVTEAALLSPALYLGMGVLFGFKKKEGLTKKRKLGGMLGVIVRGLGLLNDNIKPISGSITALTIIGTAIATFSLSALAIVATGVLLAKAWPAVLLASAFVAGLVTVFAILGSKIVIRSTEAGIKEVLIMSAAIGILATTAVLVSLVGKFLTIEWNSFLSFGAYLALLVGTFTLLSWSSKWINDGAKMTIYIAAGVSILALTAVIIGSIAPKLLTNWDGMGLFIVYLGLLVGAFTGIAFASRWIENSYKPILSMSLSIILLTGCMYAITELANKKDLFWKGYGMLSAMIGIMAVMATGVAVINNIVPGGAMVIGATMNLMVAPILIVATAMSIITKSMERTVNLMNGLGLKPDNKDDRKKIIEVAVLPFSIIAGIAKYAIIHIKDLIKLPLAAIMIRRYAGIAKNVGKMANVVNDIANLKIATSWNKDGIPISYRQMTKDDFDTAKSNAKTIFDTITQFIPDIKSVSRKNVRYMKRLGKITEVVGNASEIISRISHLMVPDWKNGSAVDENGRIVKWRQMDAGDFKTAGENAKKIFEVLIGLTNAEGFDKLNITRKQKRMLKKLALVVDPIKSGSELLTNLASGVIPIYDKNGALNENGEPKISKYISFSDLVNDPAKIKTIENNISNIFATLNSVASKNLEDISSWKLKGKTKFASESVANISNIISSVVKLYTEDLSKVKNSEDLNSKVTGIMDAVLTAPNNIDKDKLERTTKQIKNTIDLFNKIDKTDVNKLKYAYSLISKLNDFSRSINGNFNKLAKCINEDLIEAIKKLNEELQNIQNNTHKPVSIVADLNSKVNSKTNNPTSTPVKTQTQNQPTKQVAKLMNDAIDGCIINKNGQNALRVVLVDE